MKIPPADLIQEMLDKKGEILIKMYGSSMSPLLSEGKQVLVKSVNPNEVYRGDVVCFEFESKLIAHRVVRILNSSPQGRRFLTKGDNSMRFDKLLLAREVVGKVMAVEGVFLTTSFWRMAHRFLSYVSFLEGKIIERGIKIGKPVRCLSRFLRKVLSTVLVKDLK